MSSGHYCDGCHQAYYNCKCEVTKMTKEPIPMKQIGELLAMAMEEACANGANSISMPDEYVAIAHFLCYPDEYFIPEVGK